jgi:hypothetical protein
MAFFKTTIQDVNKYKSEKNSKKLIKCLDNKDSTVSRAALKGLLELNQTDSRRNMTAALIRGNQPELKKILFEFIRQDHYDLVPLVIGYIADEMKKLNDKIDTRVLLKSQKNPGLYQWLSDISQQFKESSLTVLRNLLNHESLLVKIKSAEILSAVNDGEFISSWERILDDKFGIEKDYEFLSTGLNQSMNVKEIPLLFILISTIDTKLIGQYSYNLGLTDEFIHICPSLGGAPGTWVGYWKIPIKDVLASGKQKEQVSGEFRQAYREARGIEIYLLTIKCKTKLVNPNKLKEGKTNLLTFRVDMGYEKRVDKLIEISPILREGKLKKADIFQRFFSEENIKHIKRPGHIF